ncbi:hypothetical protein SAMN05216378_2787 [Paenibacillus catalpae]|uniref:ABC-2 family transporter protein n=1 Tax=Paenibacillus catalpae TaxID=1045775 RepID=A0A1I1YSF5_9BACL|nr:hypothetical protein [Paenibacillus catalpae]SFE22369.1 hypothetical protein SAMN05216378_2787 [Paenibacillus catalpae]
MKLFHYEMKKLLLNRNRLVLLAVLFALYLIVAWVSAKGVFELSGAAGKKATNEYVRLITENSGKLNPEQLEQSKTVLDAAIAQYGTGEGLMVKLNRDPVLKFHRQYVSFGNKVDEYWNGPQGIYALQEKLKQLEESGQTKTYEYRNASNRLDTELSIGEPVFKNTVFWNFFFIRFDGFMIIFLLLLVLTYFIAPLFTQEVRTEMDSIVLSTVKGRKEIVTAKLLSAGLSAAVVTVVYLAGSFIGTWMGYRDLSGIHASLRSLDGFGSSTLPISIGGAALFAGLWLIFAAVGFSMALALISSKLKSQSAAFGIGMVLLLAGSMSNYFSSAIKKLIWPIVDFNFGSLAMFSSIFGQARTYNLFGFPLTYGLAASMVCLLLALVSLLLTYAAQKKRSAA